MTADDPFEMDVAEADGYEAGWAACAAARGTNYATAHVSRRITDGAVSSLHIEWSNDAPVILISRELFLSLVKQANPSANIFQTGPET
jgi:hypothetical protein